MMRLYTLYFLFLGLIVQSCNKETSNDNEVSQSLSMYIDNQVTELDAVIACAASEESTNNTLIFYYPENGAIDIRLYETNNTDIDKSDFSKYTRVFIESEPFFNGYLGKFVQDAVSEKWFIVTYELDEEIKISNPIRTRQFTKPTVWTDEVSIDLTTPQMPNFIWENNAVGDNAIYFQVISDEQNDLLSGTYTFENDFTYYDTSNVVLNITTETPPDLIDGETYNFTLMDVSEDNWVNLVIQKAFVIE